MFHFLSSIGSINRCCSSSRVFFIQAFTSVSPDSAGKYRRLLSEQSYSTISLTAVRNVPLLRAHPAVTLSLSLKKKIPFRHTLNLNLNDASGCCCDVLRYTASEKV